MFTQKQLARHRRRMEKGYTDRCTIYEYQWVYDPNRGEDVQKPIPIVVDQPCRISQRALGTNNQTEAQNNIQYETKIFVAPEFPIQQGNMLTVTRDGVERKYHAGEPFKYPTHQEVSIQRREWA